MATYFGPDPYEHYVEMWLATTGTLDLIEGIKDMHLFDALLLGDWGLLSSDDKPLLYQLYPCGLMFVGELTDSTTFDNSFAQKSVQYFTSCDYMIHAE